MAIFQPVTSPGDLPEAGSNAENLAFDIKLDVDPSNHVELAKDIAAFANATGGVILVGAAENRRHGTIGQYKPVDAPRAKAIRDAYNLAARDRCSPQPLVNPIVIPCEEGFVVAVNVWPFPGQAVGVRIQKEPLGFAFPFRTGVETIWLSAEQLPMLMVPELRRISILLAAIPNSATIKITATLWSFSLEEVRVLENVLVLALQKSPVQIDQPEPGLKFHLPIDIIRSVWKDAKGTWQLGIAGCLKSERGNIVFVPEG